MDVRVFLVDLTVPRGFSTGSSATVAGTSPVGFCTDELSDDVDIRLPCDDDTGVPFSDDEDEDPALAECDRSRVSREASRVPDMGLGTPFARQMNSTKPSNT